MRISQLPIIKHEHQPITMHLLLYVSILSMLIGVGWSKLNLSPDIIDNVQYVNDSYIVMCLDNTEKNVTWKKNNRIIGEKAVHPYTTRFGAGRALVFEKITTEDRGVYTCHTEVDSITFKLNIISPISFMETPSKQTAQEHHVGTIKCDVSGDPKPKIVWMFEGNNLPPEKYSTINGSLRIHNVSLDDHGTFTCRAYQVSQYTSMMKDKHINLTVEHKPMLLNPTMEYTYGHIGGVVNLTCEAIAEPPATFTWLMQSKITIPGRIKTKPHLSIMEVHIQNGSMFGDYMCKATNRLGQLKQIIKLKEGVRPVKPKKILKSKGETSDMLRIEVIEPDLNKTEQSMLPIGYRFQYRIKGLANDWMEQKFKKNEDHKYTLAGLNQNTEYEIRAATINVAGTSEYTTSITAKTLGLQADSMLSCATITIPQTVYLLLLIFSATMK